MAYGRIPLHTLTQSRLNTLTRAFPSAKSVLLADRKTTPLRYLCELEFTPPQRRRIHAAARKCGVSPHRFMYNAISWLVKDVIGERRASKRQR